MTHRYARKSSSSPRAPTLRQAVRHALSPARVAGGLLTVGLVGLTSPILALELSELDGTNGFTINGINEGDNAGNSVSGVGDINGDGIDDLLIGAWSASPNGKDYAGQSYVVFGTQVGFPTVLELSALDDSNGFVLNGIDVEDFSGASVSGAGDINGDGIDDLIIGAPGAIPHDFGGYIGQSYVVFGTREGFPTVLELSDLDGSNGFILNGIDTYDNVGSSVSGTGDVNGDGIADLLIGAPGAPGGDYSGQSYVVFGTREGFPTVLELSDLDGSNGFTLNGIDTYDNAGRSVSGAGDINGNGIDDLLIGGNSESYVVFGTREGFPTVLELSDLNGSNGFTLNGAGRSVSGAGDINGDGIDDLLISIEYASPDGKDAAGQSYVVFGTQEDFPAILELSELDGTNGFVINGINEGDNAGNSVSGVGDINGDGLADLLIGADRASPNGTYSGQSYVVFGRRSGFSPTLELSDLDSTIGFVINGINSYDFAGVSVSGAGDVDGDGIDDLLIGAPNAGSNRAGQSYVVFGEGAPLGPLITVGLYDPTAGQFYLRNTLAGGPADTTFRFGPGGFAWLALGGDWNGDALITIGLYDPVASRFYLRNSLAGGAADLAFRFGPLEVDWTPLSGDWDGDDTTTVGLYDPNSGTFFLRNSHTGGPADTTFRFGPGGLGWLPLSGDWNGNGQDTVGLYDPVAGRFYLRNSHAGGPADVNFRFGPGGLGWLPLSGDWNGNGTTAIGLYDPGSGRFYLKNSPEGGAADSSFRFGPGGLGWLPVTGNWEEL